MTISNRKNNRYISQKTCGTRRGFVYTLTRWIFLMGIAFLGVWLIRKDKSTCLNIPLCKNCSKFNNCLLPRATKERNI